ncbi:chromosome partition protein Smc [Sporosarcina sp. NCCP-2222]|uniref:chromosome segregation protein SMC n=1 Tax=Sporosarcina sp. NCCP-2222 TaxID=2935073 RepID=UPI002082D3ED|nr:chromosome segregation protein SMC [Sporosarcina sp. NCCP-2222]GKV55620.1 chromosome partition protein Smc [Sporosarcina sp. NCCP-2222]
MFLKRLEIIGFKSFAERVGIDFVPGVTAVVGPNGSGKSNVTDAIRWVLGEQSAKSLRGSKMEDVIFAGSDSRKPLNFAEVTLILDNTQGRFPLDYSEISVSRRVFRSGESVYLLNGQQCRLKDINDIFMDSGLGKEAFSIISQGRVDEILNSKPEDRRSIFDEAAGVLKYKTRKRKAEHKLFETEDNLDRVLDILKELDTRIGPLQKNAEAAEKHLALSEQMRAADVQLLNFDAFQLKNDLIGEMEELDKLQAQKTEVDSALTKLEGEAEETKASLAEKDQLLDALQKQLIDLSAAAEKWEGRRLLSLEQQRNAEQHLERITHELSDAQVENEETSNKLVQTKEKLQKILTESQSVKKEIDEISQVLKRSVSETEKEIEELKSTYIERLNEEATIRNDVKHIEERLQGEKLSTDRIVQQTALLIDRRKQLEEEREIRQSKFESLTARLKDSEDQYKSAMDSLRSTENDLAEQQQLIQTALNKQHEMQGRLRALRSLESEFSGFYSGVKEILVARKADKLTGIDGAVAELVSVSTPYAKAIEIALGGAMQHIITETEQDARKAIGYLKSKNAGRATFLPRDVMKPRVLPEMSLQIAKQHPEYVGTADSLVSTADAYRVIAANLLGNTIVAKTLAGASAIAKMIGYKYRIVSLDGDVVNAGGSLTGGGVKGQSSVFSRKAELESLQSHLDKMSKSIDIGTKKISDSKMRLAQQMHEADSLQKELEKIRQEKATVENRMRETMMEIRTVDSEIATSEIGMKGAETAGSELAAKRQHLLQKHQTVKNDLETLQAEIAQLERLASDRRTEEAALLARNSELRERAAVLREQVNFHQTSVSDMERLLLDIRRKVDRLTEERQFLSGKGKGNDYTPEEIEKQIEESATAKKSIESKVDEERAVRVLLAETLQEKEETLKKLRAESDRLVKLLNDLNVVLSRLEVKYESVTSRLLDEYGLFPDMESVLEDFDAQQIRLQVNGLKEELEELGAVNPSSIQEFKEVSERHQFLTEQRNDLLEAKKTLTEAMSEMDREMESRFATTFHAVKSRFHIVFKEMFGGGDADLILTEPENLLETGIEIVARPPGKKLQSLSLLSGGERALTAIALLFSIIEVRPVPFVILDEVEAALDEANVIRYSKYLKKFSDNTQFIVITHRKGTMEGADVLYGITMQESGVSKLISVKLSEVPVEAMS